MGVCSNCGHVISSSHLKLYLHVCVCVHSDKSVLRINMRPCSNISCLSQFTATDNGLDAIFKQLY